MGREVRRVPENWEHPRQEGCKEYQPLYDEDYDTVAAKWLADAVSWSQGQHPDQSADWAKSAKDSKYFWEWEGEPPDKKYYRPAWPTKTRTHLQMYETCTEGTPISPVMETPEELARWLADNDASAFGDMTATYEQWLAVCKDGWAPSAVMVMDKDGRGAMMSDVAAMTELEK